MYDIPLRLTLLLQNSPPFWGTQHHESLLSGFSVCKGTSVFAVVSLRRLRVEEHRDAGVLKPSTQMYRETASARNIILRSRFAVLDRLCTHPLFSAYNTTALQHEATHSKIFGITPAERSLGWVTGPVPDLPPWSHDPVFRHQRSGKLLQKKSKVVVGGK